MKRRVGGVYGKQTKGNEISGEVTNSRGPGAVDDVIMEFYEVVGRNAWYAKPHVCLFIMLGRIGGGLSS